MIRKYHDHKLQTNSWYRDEESQSNHETPGRQTKQSNQLSLPHQDDCKTRMDINNAQQNRQFQNQSRHVYHIFCRNNIIRNRRMQV